MSKHTFENLYPGTRFSGFKDEALPMVRMLPSWERFFIQIVGWRKDGSVMGYPRFWGVRTHNINPETAIKIQNAYELICETHIRLLNNLMIASHIVEHAPAVTTPYATHVRVSSFLRAIGGVPQTADALKTHLRTLFTHLNSFSTKDKDWTDVQAAFATFDQSTRNIRRYRNKEGHSVMLFGYRVDGRSLLPAQMPDHPAGMNDKDYYPVIREMLTVETYEDFNGFPKRRMQLMIHAVEKLYRKITPIIRHSLRSGGAPVIRHRKSNHWLGKPVPIAKKKDRCPSCGRCRSMRIISPRLDGRFDWWQCQKCGIYSMWD